MGILVLYNDNIYDIVSDDRLDQLISENKIIGFHRSTEWVHIGRDPLRREKTEFRHRERRGEENKHILPS